MMRKKFFWIFCLFACLATPVVYKALPVVRDKECYRSFFPKEKFLAKLAGPIPEWMQAQIDADLGPFPEISQEALGQTFEKCSGLPFDRYRIVGNQLYKYAAKGQRVSSRDNAFERALKTLLLYAKVPDVDFIYCAMDGLPEPYVPNDCYLANSQAPVFAKARLKSAPFVVLIPDQFSLSENWFECSEEILAINEEIDWENKKPIAMWRGGLTDIGIPNTNIFAPDFRECPRYKISTMSPEWVDAGLQWSDCPEMDHILQQEGAMKGGASKKGHLEFKYLPVLDGHMCTYPGYQWRLLSTSAAFKQESEQEQWFYSALRPFVHYVPIQNDMSDLIEKVKWAREHDSEVRQIVQNAREFAVNHLMPEDDYLYLYLALKEYGARQKLDPKMGMEWKCIHYRKRQDLFKSWKRIMNPSS